MAARPGSTRKTQRPQAARPARVPRLRTPRTTRRDESYRFIALGDPANPWHPLRAE